MMAERIYNVHLTKSHPLFATLFNLANDLGVVKNPQRWFNTAAEDRADFMTDVERIIAEDKITQELHRELDRAEQDVRNIEQTKSDAPEFGTFLDTLDMSGLE